MQLEKMTYKKDSSVLGAWTFFASSHGIDVCGINGLPLTPNSIRILGQFQKLKVLTHKNLCSYLDIKRGKHERIMIICEHYEEGLYKKAFKDLGKNYNSIVNIIYEVLDGLSYLHRGGITHRSVCPRSIHFDSQGHVKLSNYGLYLMTEEGSTISFPIGSPKYTAPEVLINGPNIYYSHPKCDVWSLGLLFLEMLLGVDLWSGFGLSKLFQELFSLSKLGSGIDVIHSISQHHNKLEELKAIPKNLFLFLAECLIPRPGLRKDSITLLHHPVFKENALSIKAQPWFLLPKFLSTQLRCWETKNMMNDIFIMEDHLSQRPLEEVYYLWQLAGGDVETELRRQELIKAKPPAVTVSKIAVGEGQEFGHQRDHAFLLDDSILALSFELLKHRLKDVNSDINYPLIEYNLNDMCSIGTTTLRETEKLPLVIKEKDVEYQFYRSILFRRLLEAYPFKRYQILQESKLDIPPVYRSRIWAALLEIEGNIHAIYDSIDKETPTPTDRQIEVDIPRCHQYDELLSSPIGHLKFKRILKAWVVSHPQYVYWQGLDSLCAPFLSLNFNDEALAYACLSTFIPKYLHDFFLKDNSEVIQEYLVKFSHLIAYHDPELSNHLDDIGFIPELYAIPWFLTMYTHIFPLHKILHLWDTLLLGQPCFPLCIGVAILKQLRNNILSYGFNECILMFSDMPEIDIQRCVQDSIQVFCSTPSSLTFRVYENKNPKANLPFVTSRTRINTDVSFIDKDLGMFAVSLSELKSETCPRISAWDLLNLLDLLPDARKKLQKHQNKKILAIDIRTNEEFCKGSLLHSFNIPYENAFKEDITFDTLSVPNFKGKIIAVIGSEKDKLASKFASKLVKLGYSHVCILHGGIEVLRKTGLLNIKTD